MEEQKSALSNEELQQLIAANKLERERNAATNIQKALQADGCVLHTLIEFASDGRIVSVGYKTVSL